MNGHKGVDFIILFLLCINYNIQFIYGEIRCIEKEREALLTFKQGLIDESGILSSWGNADESKECCKWTGIRCSNTTGHVIAILLRFDSESSALNSSIQSLRGKLSSALLELRHLNSLDLSYNDFGGTKIPEFIGSIENLRVLNVSRCNFSGTIPPHLGNLTNLRILDLSFNDLSSENLDWLSRLSFLNVLDLSFANLSSTSWLKSEIPKSLGNLSHLETLSFFYCGLGGKFEEFIGNLSTKTMVSLESVDLSNNQLTGTLPDLRALSRLRELYLFGNKLIGTVPLSIGQLSKLEVLNLSLNSLQGTISEANFDKLDNLKLLDLSFNSLTMKLGPHWNPPFQLIAVNLASCNVGPDFPKWIQTQRNFTSLDLSCAGITDEVPKWLWNLSATPVYEYLNLSHNQIRGTIPDLSSHVIHNLDVSSNKFSGPIPLFHADTRIFQLSQNMFSGSISSICTLPSRSLVWLDLSSNQLGGELPKCWGNMESLIYLNLANNRFSGEIPHALGSLQYLKALHLRNNNFSGYLPSTLKNCQDLMLVDVGRNKLGGNILGWISAYKSMKYLSLGHNRFYGNIPPEICNLTLIQVLNLSENNISGEIPHCFDKFTSFVEQSSTSPLEPLTSFAFAYAPYKWGVTAMDYYEYALVQWKGKESEYRKTLVLLKFVDLSSNRLIGNIPTSFSSLKALHSLNLSRNSLTGNIMSNIGEMKDLEALDLSRNQLSGKIPVGMAQLNFLSVLDLANNNLTGTIPLSTQLQSFNASAYAGNNGLCGRPLPLCVNTSIDNQGENINNRDGGFLSLSSLQELCISIFLGFFVGFWGVVGSLVLKKSWRLAYFDFLDDVGDWLCATTLRFLTKFRRS